MLHVFSVILEYRMDGRNSSARPTVRPQSLHCMCILLMPCRKKWAKAHWAKTTTRLPAINNMLSR